MCGKSCLFETKIVLIIVNYNNVIHFALSSILLHLLSLSE